MKKKILLVSSSFYPEISPRSFRATELAKEYFTQGHDVTVITKYREFDYSEFLSSYKLTLRMWDKPNMPLFNHASRIGRICLRILMLLFEYPDIQYKKQVVKMLKKESGYDLMISFAVPHPVHWGVAKVRSDKHIIAKTWVADCGDPYMFTRLDRFRKPFYFKYPELNFGRKCDFITVPFENMSNQFYPELKSKIKVIPQGFNFDELKLSNGEPDNERVTFIFAGSVIPGKRDLSLFLNFLSTTSVDFLFIAYTNQYEWFAQYKSALGDKIELREYVDRLALIYEMSKADFLVNVDTIHDNQENIEAIPSKLIDYALSNRPILNLKSDFIDKDLIMEFINKDYSRQRKIDKSKYDIKAVSTSFLKLVLN